MKVKDKSYHEGNAKVKVEKVNVKVLDSAASKKQVKVKKPSPAIGKREFLRHLINVKEIFTWSNATPIRNKTDAGYSCCYCASVYEDPAALKKHTRANHKGIESGYFKGSKLSEFCVKIDITDLHCNICLEDIVNIDALIKHLNDVHEKKLFTDINNHFIPFKLNSGKLQCCICSVEFQKFKILQEHMNKHARNYVCPECDAGFFAPRQLTAHRERHREGKFKCVLCSETFSTMAKKKHHVRCIHKALVNKCRICNQLFKEYHEKIIHMRDIHQVQKEHKCSACDKIFYTHKAYKTHMQRDHLMERRHKCDFCDKSFYRSRLLVSHMKTHTGKRDFQCDICLKRYVRKDTLREHMRIHADDRRFKCDFCGQSFVQKCSWRGHMRTKHGW